MDNSQENTGEGAHDDEFLAKLQANLSVGNYARYSGCRHMLESLTSAERELYWGVVCNKPDLVKDGIKNGADVNRHNGMFLRTALDLENTIASYDSLRHELVDHKMLFEHLKESPSLLKAELKAELKADAIDNEIYAKLLLVGRRIDEVDKERHRKVVAELLEAGALTTLKDSHGNALLHEAVNNQKADPAIVKMLLAAEADVDAVNNHEETARHIAHETGSYEKNELHRRKSENKPELPHTELAYLMKDISTGRRERPSDVDLKREYNIDLNLEKCAENSKINEVAYHGKMDPNERGIE